MEERLCSEFAKLVETVAKLRAPGGCPWDRRQTHKSLKRHLIEEAYELLEAIESGDPKRLEDELGDLLLQVLLHAEIAAGSGEFDIADVCEKLRGKLVHRHPHVFGDVEVSGVDDVLDNWEQIKRTEPGYDKRSSVLDGVPESLPALMRAAKLSKKAARTGFDWPDAQSILEKLKEETEELENAVKAADKQEIEREIGDLLFTMVNIARFEGVDPELALRGMLARFIRRFSRIEKAAEQTGRSIKDMTLEEMDQVWEEAKRGKAEG